VGRAVKLRSSWAGYFTPWWWSRSLPGALEWVTPAQPSTAHAIIA
jgi:hypothetical protein